MECPSLVRLSASSLLCLSLLACNREAPAPAAPVAPPAPAPAVVEEEVVVPELKDVMETTPKYIVGISYPPSAVKYPGLATLLKQYAEAARAELLQAVEAMPAKGSDGMMYDLTLSFTEVHQSPELVAIAVDGSRFTGGAHGEPMIARWVWLPKEERQLTAADLIVEPKAWRAVAGNVREQLHTALSQRLDADGLSPAERSELARNAGKMIDDGTEPDPEHFAMFEPVMTSSGKIGALRFVFPPYQVGPYSDGTQTVDVPAAVLMPLVADKYRDLFEVTGAPAPTPPPAKPVAG